MREVIKIINRKIMTLLIVSLLYIKLDYLFVLFCNFIGMCSKNFQFESLIHVVLESLLVQSLNE